MSPKKDAEKSTSQSQGFTQEERAAMKQAMKERKANLTKEEDEKAVLEKIEEMQEPDRAKARRIHAIIKANAPSLDPKLWYGMPAYARDGKVVCFFQDAAKFKYRYATLGFQDAANIDEGAFWPTAYAVMDLTPAVEARIADLVKKAVG